jgi:hypothetical protein
VDRSGQRPVDNPAVAAGRLAVGGRDPPAAGLAGVTVAALNTYKKNFLKNLLH